MEILLTIVITLMFVALLGAGITLVTVYKKVNDLEGMNNQMNSDIEYINKDLIDRIDGWVSSTDRRFDKLLNDLEQIKKIK
tara:strand:- start:474 stop:716 length:243 start_codon:yes stop_codon:yes gene_type:complete